MRSALRFICLVSVAVLAAFAAAVGQAQITIPPAPTAWVTDRAALLSEQTVSEQNARLREYERETGHQILVYIAPTTGGVPIEDWSVRAFEKWKVGRKGLDDGLVLFIFSRDHTLHIEVGYGLESRIPDVLASRIIRETIVPAIVAGQPDRAVSEGVDRILNLAGAAATQNQTSTGADAHAFVLGPVQFILIALFGLVVLVVVIRSPWLVICFLINFFGRRGGGSFSGGGGFPSGGFTGGGGRSGGGGASGSW
jgi:uncharacterized protein